MIVISDHWEGVLNDDHIDRSPDLKSIEALIDGLDGNIHTLITLDDEKNSNLFIGGGQEGLIVAYSFGEKHLLARQGDGTKMVLITTGGQAGEYRERNVISLQHAKDLAKAFFRGVDVQSLGQWDTV